MRSRSIPTRPVAQDRRGRRRPSWFLAALLAIGLVIAGGLLSLAARPGRGPTDAPAGVLAAERTTYDFGQVRMGDGLLRTSFPLTVDGPVLVTDLGTT